MIIKNARYIAPEGLVEFVSLLSYGLLGESEYPAEMDGATRCANINKRRHDILAIIPREIARIEASRVEVLGETPLPDGPERKTTADVHTPAAENEEEEEGDDQRVAKRSRGPPIMQAQLEIARIHQNIKRMEIEQPVLLAESEVRAIVVRESNPYLKKQVELEMAEKELELLQKQAAIAHARAALAKANAEVDTTVDLAETKRRLDREQMQKEARAAEETRLAEEKAKMALIETRLRLEQQKLEDEAERAKVKAAEEAERAREEAERARVQAAEEAQRQKAKDDAAAAAAIQTEHQKRVDAVLQAYARATFSEKQEMRTSTRHKLSELLKAQFPDPKVLNAKISNMLRNMNQFETRVYVLTNDDETKFYVGEADNVNGRLRRHVKGDGARWTDLHKLKKRMEPPVRRNGDTTVWEDACVLELMVTHGIDHVRGGQFSMIKFTPEKRREAIRACIHHSNPPLCARCGRPDHFVMDCDRTRYAQWMGGGRIEDD